jgi:hypothetical protein
MFDLFGLKRKKKEKAEVAAKARLALALESYVPEDEVTTSEFTDIDFGEGIKRVRKEQIDIRSQDPWAVNHADTTLWHREHKTDK